MDQIFIDLCFEDDLSLSQAQSTVQDELNDQNICARVEALRLLPTGSFEFKVQGDPNALQKVKDHYDIDY